MSDSLKEIMRGVRMHLQGRPMDIDDGRYGVSWNDGISGYDMICIYIYVLYIVIVIVYMIVIVIVIVIYNGIYIYCI